MKMVLSAFEQLLGIKINYHKSELFCFGEAQVEATQYVEIFECKKAFFLLDIWVPRFIIRDFQILNGNMWKNA